MLYGTIVEYFPEKKIGFIRPDGGRDVFFHASALEAGQKNREIKRGQPVSYELMPKGEESPKPQRPPGKERPADKTRRPQATAKLVVLIDKLPGGSLADSDTSHKPARHERARKKKPTWRR